MISAKNLNFQEEIFNSLCPISEEKVILACSGGPDSMVLLDILTRFYGDEATLLSPIFIIDFGKVLIEMKN
jgi:tRNA(Ile)-lysidine synthase TilS/MesJ